MSEFDNIVNGILNEQDDNTSIPALDGIREIYTITLGIENPWHKEDDFKTVYMYRLKRVDKNSISETMWDGAPRWKTEYTGNNHQQAKDVFEALVMRRIDKASKNSSTTLTVASAFQQLQTIAHVMGTWKVFSTSDNITIGVEVAVDKYSGAHNAIDDDINNF